MRTKLANKIDESIQKSLIGIIIEDFGGISFLIASTETMFRRIDTKKWGKIGKLLKIFRIFILFATPMYQISLSIKKWLSLKNEVNVDQEIRDKISKKLGCEYAESYRWTITKAVFIWLLKSPKTKHISILGYYDKNFNRINVETVSGEVFIHIKTKEGTFFISGFVKELSREEIDISDSHIWSAHWIESSDINKEVMKDFISTYDLEKNVIEYDGISIVPRPRRKVRHNVTHFDVKKMLDELKRAKEFGIARSILFSGPPGNGKTDIINKLEEVAKGLPIIITKQFSLRDVDNISYIFDIANIFDECIIVFEDIDTYDLERKSSPKSLSFLTGLDSSKRKSGVSVLATSNSRIHETFMRRGRFDIVHYIETPETTKEVFDVISNRCKEMKFKVPNMKSIETFLESCIGYSRSDLCEIVNYIKISGLKMNQKSLILSKSVLEETIEAAKKIKPDKYASEIDDDECSEDIEFKLPELLNE